MPAQERTKSTAESYVRGLFANGGDRAADLGVLALERALVRGGFMFDVEGRGDPASPFALDSVPYFAPPVPGSGRVGPFDIVSPQSATVDTRCRHVVDWIAQAVLNGSAWLERTDAEGRPLKLMKLGSLDRAVAEADKEMRRFASRVASTAIEAGDEALEMRLADGWTVVRLLTPASLDLESGRMGHCIGQGAYDSLLEDDVHRYYSLRDPHGKPHATLEVDTDTREILQFQGKQNDFPMPEYARRIRPFVRENCEVFLDMAVRTGLLRVKDDSMLDMDDLPDEVDVEGSLDLTHFRGRLPKKLSVSRNLDLPVFVEDGIVDCELVVGGNLALENGNVRSFAKPVRVRGELLIHECPIRELHPETVVGRGLDLRRLPHLEELPAGVLEQNSGYVARFIAEKTALRSLRPLREVGELHLVECPIEDLPANLTVLRMANISNCPMKVLRAGTLFRGDVVVEGDALEHVERNTFGGTLEITRHVTADRKMPAPAGPKISMDEGIVVVGRLRLTDVDMDDGLPKDLDVGSLSVVGGTQGSGPGPVRVRYDAEIVNCRMKSLPPDFRCGGNVSLKGGRIGSIDPGLDVAGDLKTENARIDAVGESCRIGGRVRGLAPGGLATIGAGFSIGILGPSSFPATTTFGEGMRVGALREPAAFRGRLPKGLVVAGDLDLSEFDPAEVPEDLVVEGRLTPPSGGPSFG